MGEAVGTGRSLGRFELGEELGRGAMGAVFASTDPETDREVVVKVLLPGLGDLEQIRMRFIREAETYRKLQHPGVVEYVASGIEGDVFYLVLERVRGPTLIEVIEQRPLGLGLEESLRVMRRIAEVLAVAHEMGVVHRDLKPDNVIMDDALEPKLIDFGLAAADDALLRTRTGTRFGSYFYASPEQNDGRKVDHRADLFSLGVLGYQALTRKLPFQGSKVIHVMLDQMNEKYDPPSEQVAGIPPEVDALFWRLFRADPERRFQSAAEVVEAIAAVEAQLEGQGTRT